MTAPTIRSVGANATGTTSATPGLPSGGTKGDLYICIAASSGAASEPTMSADWQKIRTVKNGTALTDSMLTVWYAVEKPTAISRVVSGTTNHVSARIIAITGFTFNPLNPINAKSAGNVQASTTSVSISGLTTTVDECLVLSISGASLPDANSTAQYASWTNASLASITERTDNNVNNGNGGGHGSASGVKTTAGVVSATTATKASAALLANLMIAIEPMPDGPIPISSIEDLDNIRLYNGDGRIKGSFILTKNLDFNDDASYVNPARKFLYTEGLGFKPLGRISPEPWFGGTFDGDGYTISNLMINDGTTGQSNSGLFGVTDSSTIKNVGLINPRINANATTNAFNQCGALVMGYDTEGANLLQNCFVRGGVVVGGSNTGNNGTGGMVGIAHRYSTGNLAISDCYVEGTIVYRNGTSPASTNGVGGLVGGFTQISGSTPFTVVDCYASAWTVDGDSTAQRGGLIGYDATTATYTTSYYDSTNTNYAGGGGTAKTNANMKVYSEFSSVYSIANGYSNLTTQTWYMQSGDYPRLYYENYAPSVTNPILSGSRTVTSYYVDGSDVAVSDPNNHWGSDTNLTNGTFNSYATNNGASGSGSVSTGYLEATGTNAPGSGGHIYSVRARFHSTHAITDNETAHLNVYHSSELLGYTSRGPIGGTAYSDYVTLKTPAGGWTWAKIQALRGRVWATRMINSGYVGLGIIDIEVTSETPPSTGATPALVMNGVDLEGNDVRYQVEVSDSPHMIPYADNQNYIATNVGGITGDSTAASRRAQSFTTKTAGDITSIMVRVGRTGTPADSVTLKLYSDSSNSPNSVIATATNTFLGADLSQNDINSGNFTTLRFNFTGATVASSTRYWLAVERTGAVNASNYYNVEGSSSISYESESGRIYNGSTWATTGVLSLLFDVQMRVSQTSATYTSGTDSGFTGSPDNSDPFASAQDVTHTIQSALADGTYYWRVRGIDPTGSNKYGTWTSPSSFTVSGVANYNISHGTSAVKKRQYTQTHTTSANKKVSGTTKTHTTGSVLRKQFTKTHTTDALKRKAFTLTHTTDANKKKATTLVHTTSANKKTAGLTRTHTTDAMKKAVSTKTHTTDILKRIISTLSHTTSANKRTANITRTHTTDSNKKKATTVLHTTNALLRKIFTALHTTSANKKIADNLRTHSSDSNKKKANNTLTHTLDSLKRIANTISHTTDAYTHIGVSTYNVDHNTDSLKRTTNTLSHTSSSVKRPIVVSPFAKVQTINNTFVDVGSSTVITPSSPTSRHNLVVIYVRTLTNTLSSVTDNASNTYSILTSNSGVMQLYVVYGMQLNSSTSITLNFANSDSRRYGIDEFSGFIPGLTTAEVYDNSSSYTNYPSSSTSISVPVFNTSKVGNLIVGGVASNGNATWTAGVNYTLSGLTTSSSLASQYRLSGDFSETAPVSVNGSSNIYEVAISFHNPPGIVAHTVDAFKRKEYSSSHTTDSNLKKSTDIVHTTSSNKKKETTLVHTADSNKKRGYTVAHSSDSNKKKAGNLLTHTTNALLRKIFTLVHSSDALKRTTSTADHSTDSFLRKQAEITHTTDSFLYSISQSNHTTDSNKKKETSAAHSSDALKRTIDSKIHTTDALKRARVAISHNTGSFLRIMDTLAHSVDSFIRKTNTRTHTSDTLIRKTNTEDHTTDSNKRKATTSTHTTDANKKVAGNTRAHSTDSLKRTATIVTHTTDALLRLQVELQHSTDSFLRTIFSKQHTTDSNKKRAHTVDHTGDSNKRRAYTVLHTTSSNRKKADQTTAHSTDALKRTANTLSQAVDSLLRGAVTLSHSIDTLLRKENSLTHTVDSFLRKANIRSHTTDSNKKAGYSSTHTTDGLKRTGNTITHSTDGLLRGENELQHTTDSNQRRAQEVAHNTDTLLTSATAKNHNTDANRKRGQMVSHDTSANKRTANLILTHTTNALLRAVNAITHLTSSNKRKATQVAHTIDTLIRKANVLSHLTDALKRTITSAIHTTDSLLRTENTKDHSTDSFKRIRSILSHLTDSNKRKATTISHTTDGYLRGANQVVHSTDGNKRRAQQVAHDTDALKRAIAEIDHSTDSFLSKRTELGHSTDSFIRIAVTVEHSTDTVKRQTDQISHTADAFKRTGQDASHNTDASLYSQGTVDHSTDANLKTVESAEHSTDTNKTGATYVSHGTSSNLKRPFDNAIYATLDASPNYMDLESDWNEVELSSSENVTLDI